MLTFKNVALRQGAFQLTADFSVPNGVTAVIGPSGEGKSTLLSAIAGFLTPVSGTIMWEGQSLNESSPAERPVSVLFQDNNLFPHLTIAQNVGLGMRSDLRLSPLQKHYIDETLQRVGLAGFDHRKPGALSGGQQSRTALARVLVSQRPLVLLDEPFAALGPALKKEMLHLVQETLAANGRSVVMVTHDPKDAQHVADQVVLVAQGSAQAPVETKQIFANPPAALQNYLD